MSKEIITTIIKKELNKEKYNEIVFLCIGTNGIIGDSVGPKTGSILKKLFKNGYVRIISASLIAA